jgi:Transposase DDE domain group 1
MTTTPSTSSTSKVRRESLGGKRPEGWQWQRDNRRVRRANACAIGIGHTDASLSAVGGLVSFNAFVQRLELGQRLRKDFGHLKKRRGVVYPMHTQMQLFLDASVVGAKRIFEFEALASDPLFAHLAGGIVPSIDVLYDDLRRFEVGDLERLEALMAEHGLAQLKCKRFRELTVDIDTTVTPLFGTQEGAKPGPNPRYHGRPSYHPILARIAETDTVLGARLRHGDTGLGERDVEDLEQWLTRLHAVSKAIVTVRIDAGGDCAALLSAIDRNNAYFVVKAKQTQNLVNAVFATNNWRTVDRDAFEQPTRQVAVIDFQRSDWPPGRFRVFAIRTSERESGKQTCLWDDLDHSVSVYITNDTSRDLDELARCYDERAAIEPLIAELKNGFGIGKASTNDFDANEAAFLLKLLAYNLMRRWASESWPAVSGWRASWIRRACVLVPARLLRSGGRWELRMAPRPMLN